MNKFYNMKIINYDTGECVELVHMCSQSFKEVLPIIERWEMKSNRIGYYTLKEGEGICNG